MTSPITPQEVQLKRKKVFPKEIIDVFNSFIILNWNGQKSVVKQSSIINYIKAKMDITDEEIFDKHYLDIEEIYKEVGWVVEYNKPTWDETFEAYFVFTIK
jgi:hypothetical protein